MPKNFFKENYVLVCGIAMPLILALVFFIAAHIPMTDTVTPRDSVVFVTGNFSSDWQFEVNHGTLYVAYAKPEHPRPCCNAPPIIHVFDTVTKTDRKIDPPVVKTDESLAETPLPELKDTKLDASDVSPDGFTFERDQMNDTNIITAMFGGDGGDYGDRGPKYVLLKGHNRLTVPSAPAYNTRFIGWVVK